MKTRIVWVAVAVFALVGGVAIAVVAHDLAGKGAPAAAAPGSPAIPARPIPAHPPAPVRAPGACGTTMAEIRALQRRYPSGAMLTDTANAQLTADLTRLDGACASHRDLEQEFRDRELTPWLTYLPPGAS